jgi:hypothetical protein
MAQRSRLLEGVRLMRRITLGLALAALLGGCASYQDRTSPCVCDWRPIGAGHAPDEGASA